MRVTRAKGPTPLDSLGAPSDRKRKMDAVTAAPQTDDANDDKRRKMELPLTEEEDFLPKEDLETDDAWLLTFNRLRRLCTSQNKFPKLDFKRDSELIRWLNIQHLHQKDLSKTQKKLLNQIGYDWQRIMFKGTWDDNVEKLISLKRKDGTFGISGLRVKDPRFYSWAVNARYRARWGGMTSKKICQLRDIGFLEELESSSNDERAEPAGRRSKKVRETVLPGSDDEKVSADEHHTEDEVEAASARVDFEEEDRFDIFEESEEDEEAVAMLMLHMVNHNRPLPYLTPIAC